MGKAAENNPFPRLKQPSLLRHMPKSHRFHDKNGGFYKRLKEISEYSGKEKVLSDDEKGHAITPVQKNTAIFSYIIKEITGKVYIFAELKPKHSCRKEKYLNNFRKMTKINCFFRKDMILYGGWICNWRGADYCGGAGPVKCRTPGQNPFGFCLFVF